jgi:hypothetical protein
VFQRIEHLHFRLPFDIFTRLEFGIDRFEQANDIGVNIMPIEHVFRGNSSSARSYLKSDIPQLWAFWLLASFAFGRGIRTARASHTTGSAHAARTACVAPHAELSVAQNLNSALDALRTWFRNAWTRSSCGHRTVTRTTALGYAGGTRSANVTGTRCPSGRAREVHLSDGSNSALSTGRAFFGGIRGTGRRYVVCASANDSGHYLVLTRLVHIRAARSGSKSIRLSITPLFSHLLSSHRLSTGKILNTTFPTIAPTEIAAW